MPPLRNPMEIDVMPVGAMLDIAALRHEWRALDDSGLTTPYQSFDWINAWRRSGAASAEGRSVLVILREGDDLLAILPLTIRRQIGLTVARLDGGECFNLQMPPMSAEASLAIDEAGADALLERIGRSLGVDALQLDNQPAAWNGRRNPFVTSACAPASSPTFALSLRPDFGTLARERRSAKSLQQIRRKRRHMEAALGPVRLWRARGSSECARVIAEAARHRATRKAAAGVPSFFDMPFAEDFLLRAAVSGEPGNEPLWLHYLQAGDTIVATYIGAVKGGVYSCFVNSFDPAYDAFSPGETILHDLIAELCESGITLLDLGVGDERYKRSWCDPVPLYQRFLPVTKPGRLMTRAGNLVAVAKRGIKQNALAWQGWRALRRIGARAFG